MTGEMFVKIIHTGIDALGLIKNIANTSITFTCICGYDDNTTNTETFYICSNCQRVYVYSIQFTVYNPNEISQ